MTHVPKSCARQQREELNLLPIELAWLDWEQQQASNFPVTHAGAVLPRRRARHGY
jgi:hypothetical protein